MTDGSPLYQLKNLEKHLGDDFTLSIGEMAVKRGEVLGLLGPTGAGKSTLLRILAALETPTRGEILFEGTPLVANALSLAVRRRITLVHQRPLLLAGSVRNNVVYGLKLRGVRDRESAVDRVLDQLRLSTMVSQSARTLSGGQVQLVALARALVIEPDVLLLDEPTAHLDPAHVALIEQAVQMYRRQSGATVVWATHNLFQAQRVTDRAALLLNGTLVESKLTSEFFTNPSNPQTADFIHGRMIY